jgi:hypothetical protein
MHSAAAFQIGVMYRQGSHPLPEIPMLAYMWYSIAQREGYAVPKAPLEALKNSLPPGQLTEAEKLVDEWAPNPDECKGIPFQHVETR